MQVPSRSIDLSASRNHSVHSSLRQPAADETAGSTTEFRAQPAPRAILTAPQGVPARQAPPATKPQSPALQLKQRMAERRKQVQVNKQQVRTEREREEATHGTRGEHAARWRRDGGGEWVMGSDWLVRDFEYNMILRMRAVCVDYLVDRYDLSADAFGKTVRERLFSDYFSRFSKPTWYSRHSNLSTWGSTLFNYLIFPQGISNLQTIKIKRVTRARNSRTSNGCVS